MNLETLRRFTKAAPPAPVVERCDLCGVPVGAGHGHLVALDERALRCACQACYLLFTHGGAGRFVAVPRRYLTDPARPVAAADWDALGIPVGTAFFFTNSALDRVVACYPSPAGVTECELDLASYERLREAYPLLGMPEPDVEAILVSDGEAFLVPIDSCYSFVGQLRTEPVREALARYLADLRTRARPV
jgi:hypothetical protein